MTSVISHQIIISEIRYSDVFWINLSRKTHPIVVFELIRRPKSGYLVFWGWMLRFRLDLTRLHHQFNNYLHSWTCLDKTAGQHIKQPFTQIGEMKRTGTSALIFGYAVQLFSQMSWHQLWVVFPHIPECQHRPLHWNLCRWGPQFH